MDDLFNRVARRRSRAQPGSTAAGVGRRRRRGQQGFTLIELLVVIAVLAVLAGIVIFNVAGVNQRGSLAACQTDLKSVQTASDAYYNDQSPHAYPGSLDALVPAYLHTKPPATEIGTVSFNTDGHGTVTSSVAGCTL
ncbi:MAG TPA: type II secretion system protein [Candidatus Dormibacteraeota bacterium]